MRQGERVCEKVRQNESECEKVELAKVSRSDGVVCLFAKFLFMFMSAASTTKKSAQNFFGIIFVV